MLREGYDPAYGARPLRRTIQRLIQDPLAMQILEGSRAARRSRRVDRDGQKDVMRFERVPQKKPAAAAVNSWWMGAAALSAAPGLTSPRSALQALR